MRQTLFTIDNNHRVNAFINAVREPAEPEDEISLKELMEVWEKVTQEYGKNIHYSLYLYGYDLNYTMLPERENLKRGKTKTIKGWKGYRLDEEEASTAVREVTETMQKGQKFLSSLPN